MLISQEKCHVEQSLHTCCTIWEQDNDVDLGQALNSFKQCEYISEDLQKARRQKQLQ